MLRSRFVFSVLLAVTSWGRLCSAAPASGAAVCLAPKGEWITGADLAAAVPALRGLAADINVSYAPVAGFSRVFLPGELHQIARAHGLPAPPATTKVCYAWPLAPLSPADLRSAMEKALTGRLPDIEIVAESKAEAPAGEVIFPLSGLTAYSENPAIWKGFVRYAGNRHFETWASVRVRVHETHLKARGVIHAGERVSPNQWRAEGYFGPLVREVFVSDGSQLEGQVARHDLADGDPLLAVYFESPKAVERGDTVTVIAGEGAAHIETPGEALAAGRAGEVIPVRNLRSNRTFKARIAAAGRVEVLPGTSVGLVASEPAGKNPL